MQALILVVCAGAACALMVAHLVGRFSHVWVPVLAVLVNAIGVAANSPFISEFMGTAGQAIGMLPAGTVAVLAITLWLVLTGLLAPYLLTHTPKFRELQKA